MKSRTAISFSLLLLVLGLQDVAFSQASSQPKSDQVLDFDTELSVDSNLRTGVLKNGLRFYIRTNSRPENRAELWLAVNAGSMQEDEDQKGLAHFVEHMAFNGTENFAKHELVDYLESIGMRFGPDVNAFTSFDETVYTLRVPTEPETIAKAFQILEDWAHAVSFEDEEIDKERGVVIEEWRLGRGAEARIRDKEFPVLFKGSRYAERLPIGTKDILENAPYDALRRFYSDWYRPELMAVIAVGDFDPDKIEALIRQHFGKLEGPDAARTRETFPVPDHEETLYSVNTDPEMTMTTVGVYHKLDKRPQSRVGDYRRSIAEGLYHGIVNARLDEILQQPDPPFLFGFAGSAGFVRSKDVYLQVAGVQEGQVESGLEALLHEIERVDRHGFTAGELERAKVDMLRQYEKAYAERDKRESSTYANEYLRVFLEDEPTPGIEAELELVKSLLPTISLTDLNKMADQWITDSNRVVLVGGPEKEGVVMPNEPQLAAVFDRVEGEKLEAYVDRVRNQPLLAEKPSRSEVIESSEIAQIGVTEWRLKNGIKVVLKPTDFKNDQILITGFSPGGTSLVSDEQHTSASFATTVVGEGGLGEFDQIELEKALAGKLAGASPYISELEEGIEGSASPQDLATMFQLLYMTITEPRRDETAFQSFMTRMESFIENRRARPEAVFGDEITVARYKGHPRRRPISLELLSEVDLNTAMNVYRDRFEDASDFTFILVGNFDIEGIRPLVETYLGGLPSTGRDETWRDVGAYPDDAAQTVTVRQGLEPKSRVSLIWSGEADWSRENLHDIVSLASAFRIRLREVLREDMGAVYGVGVNGSLVRRPKERFSFSIGFGCSPENATALIQTIRDEIAILRKEGLDTTYVEKVQESQRRQREINMKENSFWLTALKTYYSLELDPLLILEHEALVARISTENLETTANLYLDPEVIFEAVLFPQEAETENK